MAVQVASMSTFAWAARSGAVAASPSRDGVVAVAPATGRLCAADRLLSDTTRAQREDFAAVAGHEPTALTIGRPGLRRHCLLARRAAVAVGRRVL